ncbi:MAG: baseplate J/gp47 family protein [Patescibacteria group bacterium]
MARTYTEIVNELRQRARQRWPAWNQSAEHLGNVILDCLADQLEKLDYSIDALLDDVMPDTTSSYARLLQWARLLGYQVTSATPAEVTLTFSVAAAAPRAITIPAGTRVTTAGPDPVVFMTLATVQIAQGQTQVTISARQVVSHTDTFTANGEPHQTYGTALGPVWLNSLLVRVAGVEWSRVNDLLESDNADHHYVAEIREDGSIWVEFGDGLRGMAPGAGQQIEISYQVTRGAVGNVAADTLTVVDSAIYDAGGYLADVSVTNAAAATGGQDQEDMNHVRDALPRWVIMATRCVTKTDFQSAAESVAGVQRVLALTHEDDETIPSLTVLLYVLPVGGGAPGQALLDAVEEEVTVKRPRIATLVVDVQAAQYMTVDVTCTITVAAGYDAEDVQVAVEAAIEEFFSYERLESEAWAIDWGKALYKAKLSAWILNVPGVANVDLTAPAADVTPAADEIPALGTVSVSVS